MLFFYGKFYFLESCIASVSILQRLTKSRGARSANVDRKCQSQVATRKWQPANGFAEIDVHLQHLHRGEPHPRPPIYTRTPSTSTWHPPPHHNRHEPYARPSVFNKEDRSVFHCNLPTCTAELPTEWLADWSVDLPVDWPAEWPAEWPV